MAGFGPWGERCADRACRFAPGGALIPTGENPGRLLVMPAEAGIQSLPRHRAWPAWVPAFAGTTITSQVLRRLVSGVPGLAVDFGHMFWNAQPIDLIEASGGSESLDFCENPALTRYRGNTVAMSFGRAHEVAGAKAVLL